MIRTMTIIALFAGTLPAAAGPDCTCKYKNMDIPEGQIACLQTPNGEQMARCERVLNNTSWKFLGGGCSVSSNNLTERPPQQS